MHYGLGKCHCAEYNPVTMLRQSSASAIARTDCTGVLHQSAAGTDRGGYPALEQAGRGARIGDVRVRQGKKLDF
jgi:hypothetical protein